MASVGKNERKAQELMAQGDKETKRWFGGNSRYENASEKFDKAGLAFKLAKNYEGAAQAYSRAAEMHQKLGSENDMANSMKEAGAMYEKAGKTDECKTALEAAAELYTDMSRLSTAGKVYKQIAEMYEANHDGENALLYFQRAADTFKADSNSSSAANQCLAKVGFFYGEDESFGKAAEVFDQVGNDYLGNNLLKFNARTHFTNALMCHLANDDVVMTNRKLNEYKESDYQFADSRECRLIEGVLAAYEARDPEAFVEAISEFDRISKLNPWRIAILLKIKEKLTEEEEEDLS
mmetsp:Transcript_42764/g.87406  ORF Transcript_42764/g.87406 Transcript_42764/m.87406 type:complete len:293 (-) Transcript_42764:61-939(-)